MLRERAPVDSEPADEPDEDDDECDRTLLRLGLSLLPPLWPLLDDDDDCEPVLVADARLGTCATVGVANGSGPSAG